MSAQPTQSRQERPGPSRSFGGGPHGDFLQRATEQLSLLVGVERCTLLVVDDGRLYHGGAVGMPREYTDRIDGVEISPSGSGTCGAAAWHGRPIVTDDIATDPRWQEYRQLAAQAGLRSAWSVPVALPDGQTVGTFAAYYDTTGDPPPELIDLARAHASLVAIAFDRLRRNASRSESYRAVVAALSSALDARDKYTGTHSVATAELAVELGRRLGIVADKLRELENTAILHDVGKLGIPSEILQAARPLTEAEREIVERHPVIGERILWGMPEMGDVARAVRHEHERWDGDGYPDGLSGEDIPLASRIVLVCDAWHAMTSDRPYRAALSHDAACAELRAGAGTQFDPTATRLLLEMVEYEPGAPRRFEPRVVE